MKLTIKLIIAVLFAELTSLSVTSQCIPPALAQEICIVTVDSATNKNMIVFEKGVPFGIKNFNVYKDDGTGNFNKIGEVSVDSLSIFIDHTSDPDNKEEQYKLSKVNTCDQESPLSTKTHRSIHLWGEWTNGGRDWVCHWQQYIGVNATASTHIYKVFRGPALDQMEEVGAFFDTFNDQSWTDKDVPQGPLFYRIEFLDLLNLCIPTLKKEADNFNTSKSNTIDTEIAPGFTNTNELSIDWSVYPNPTRDNFNVYLTSGSNKPITVQVINAIGETVIEKEAQLAIGRQVIEFDSEDLPNGVYTITLLGEGLTPSKRVIITR